MSKVELKGMEDIMQKIEGLGKQANRLTNNALRKAAKPILDDAVENAPERTGKGKKGLKIGRVKTRGDKKSILIGIDQADISEIFYMKFHEFGASAHQIQVAKGNKVAGGILKNTKNKPIHHPGVQAKPFLGPALARNKKQAKEIIKNELRKGLGL